ncbi:MAG: class II fumarate hydratase [Bacteroidales bacterium]|jgi:fumarate hydratase class II|nr:class II fumarate hydratase [Bacteroidales bacterium]
MKITRTGADTMGEVLITANALWGAQTQRSLNNFKIGNIRMPIEMIRALAIIKKAAAFANAQAGVLPIEKRDLISQICDEILAGKWDSEFPLFVWQTGSGTQTNMNINEVIANRGEILQKNIAPADLPSKPTFLSANDDVNRSQSTNDVFPSAMRMAMYQLLVNQTVPALENLSKSIKTKANSFQNIIKIGRTHLMDATPLYLRDEFLTFAAQLDFGIAALKNTFFHLTQLPIGGTAVGTGLNTPQNYAQMAVNYINQFTGLTFYPAQCKSEAMATQDALVETSNALKQMAVSLTKIANDIRLLASGPRCGLAEIQLPSNEPGSSIMPGKVNPTQCEALTMVCAQVVGNDATITFSAMQGHLQLNTFMPVIAYNSILSATLLADAVNSFNINCIQGIIANVENIEKHLQNSLMLVTALNPHIGYANAAKIAQLAYNENITLKEAALQTGLLNEKDFDNWVQAEKMLGNTSN